MTDQYSFSHRGDREDNEDSMGFLTEKNRGIFVVADGLGGHEKGELASSCVVDSILESFEGGPLADPDSLNTCIGKANQRVLTLQEEHNCVMKSTVVVLSVSDNHAIWANTGDSRLYFIHDGELVRVTEDHSVAFKKYMAGEISRADIRTDEDQSRLIRTLGSEERWVPNIGLWRQELVPGDAFFLCTDGAWEHLQDEEILVDCLKAESAEEWIRLLLLRVIERLEPDCDNLTMMGILVR